MSPEVRKMYERVEAGLAQVAAPRVRNDAKIALGWLLARELTRERDEGGER